MTEDQILWEYRQLMAWQYETTTGKEASEAEQEVIWDPEYEAWQESLGIKQPHARRE